MSLRNQVSIQERQDPSLKNRQVDELVHPLGVAFG